MDSFSGQILHVQTIKNYEYLNILELILLAKL